MLIRFSILFAFIGSQFSLLQGQVSSFRTDAGGQLICAWSQVTLRNGPGKTAPYVTGVYFGEVVRKTGEEAYVREEQRSYLKVQTSEGTVGWVHEFLFVEGMGLASVLEPGRIYRRPRTVSTITDQSFLPGELVIAVNQNNGWIHLVGREKKKEGWIEDPSKITNQYRELEIASLLYEANQKNPEERQQALQDLYREAQSTHSPLTQAIEMQLRGQSYDLPLTTTGNNSRTNRPQQSAHPSQSTSGSDDLSPHDRNQYLDQIDLADRGSAARNNARNPAPQHAEGRFVEESGQVIIISSRSHEPDIFYAYHRSLPVGSRVFADIPGNHGFVELRIVGTLPASSPYVLGLPVACYDALLGNTQERSIHITYER